MRKDSITRRREILEKRLAELYEEYEAANGQLGRILAEADVLKIKRQIARLDEAIKEVEQQLGQLSGGDGHSPADGGSAAATTDAAYLVKLTDILNTRFNLGELSTLAFHLSIDLDDLPGDGKRRKVDELIKYLDRHRRIEELIRIGKQRRPDINW